MRLRYADIITCNEVVKDAAGNVTELRCTYDPDHMPQGEGDDPLGLGRRSAVSAEVRLYDHLFNVENPDDAPEGETFLDNINPNSLEIVHDAKLEPSLANALPGQHFQFERLGYFFTDPVDSKPGKPVFNRTATLARHLGEGSEEVAASPTTRLAPHKTQSKRASKLPESRASD